MSLRNQLVALAFSLGLPPLLGACASTRSSFDKLNDEYKRVETRLDQRKHDQPPWSSAELDRHALIRAVIDRNPSLESARQAWRAALARYRQAGAYDDPMVMASFAPLSIGSSSAPFGYEIGVSQRLPLGGKLDAQAELAVAEAETAASDYAQTRLRLALVASELYDDYFVAVRALEIQAQHIVLVNTLKQNAIAAYESGRASAQDSLQAEAELARLEYQGTTFQTQREVAIAQINALLHRDPELDLPPPPAELPRPDDAKASPDDLMKLVDQRPDIAAARARVRVASARGDVASTQYYPDLTLSTSYNSMWDMPQHRWMAGVSLNLPLERGRRQGAVDEAFALRAASESDVQSMKDAARGEIAVALRHIAEAERAVMLFEERLVPVARQSIEAARADFVTGRNSFMTVIEAERGLRSAELELQMARADLSKRRAGLDRVLGRIPGLGAHEVMP